MPSVRKFTEVFFMNDEQYDKIEQQIGYEFKKRLLLQQAFTRKSYTDETHDGDNNEVLEFIGDKVLDLVIVKALAETYGEVNDRDEFECEYTEGKLTELKKRLVESKMLAERIDELGFAKYLIMGKADKKNNVQETASVKEDLFEAIIGAVAIDSDWDIEAMQEAVEFMLHFDHYLENGFDDENDYVSLIQQWSQKETEELPNYKFLDLLDRNISNTQRQSFLRNAGLHSMLVTEHGLRAMDNPEATIICSLNIGGYGPFIGYGRSKSQARMDAAERTYSYLDEEGLLFSMEDEIDEPSLEKAINQLQELSQKGYFSMPIYTFEEKHDKNGNPYWLCRCEIKDYVFWYQSKASSKKEAKRQAAYHMLLSILNGENE